MSNSTAQHRALKMRPYRLGKRAEKQEATRRRIVEAAVELHSSLGPARTTVAQIAALAGVQRHTYYSHFPSERSLSLACSALAMERSPLPNPENLLATAPGAARIKQGLEQLYCWFEANERLASCVLRDAEIHDLTREMVELRMAPALARTEEIMAAGLGESAQDLLRVAMDFGCWRVLKNRRDAASAASLMSNMIWNLPDVG